VHARLIVSGEIGQYIAQQSLTMAFQDVFWLLAALFVAGLIIIPFAKALPMEATPVSDH